MKHSEHGPDGPRGADALARHDLSELAAAQPGTWVVSRVWKYNGQAHYTVPGTLLGSDEHGFWVWQPAGSFVSRPGAAFFAARACLMLVPHEGDWIASFHPRVGEDAPDWFIYVDVSMMIVASPLSIPLSTPGLMGRGVEVDSFDMDLDVVRSHRRGVFIDDEDEFLLHQRLFAYPAEVVARMRASADALAERLRAAEPPFDHPSETVDAWWRTAQNFPSPTMESS